MNGAVGEFRNPDLILTKDAFFPLNYDSKYNWFPRFMPIKSPMNAFMYPVLYCFAGQAIYGF